MISQIVLMRHATRAAVLEFGNSESSLNAVGLAQAEKLADAVKLAGKLPAPTRLLCSPKLRARQTLEPLSKASGLKIEIVTDLDERREHESLKTFEERIRKLAESLPQNETVYVCTHLDVLEVAAALWPTNFSERESAQTWSTLEFQVFKIRGGLFEAGARGRIE